jgi:hypothetical protein
MSRRAFESVQRYGMERHLDGIEAIYDEIAAQPS